ncbi:MAG TPA: glycosyltransferase [Candidatus Acidoferrales bacterium]|nr:glycosyltransferase [Candidatus Acidoferrales bacterium]
MSTPPELSPHDFSVQTVNYTVDVLMPTMNGAKYLVEALESILCQTFPDWNLIVLDGGSTDATHEILNYYAKRDSRIRVINIPGSHPTKRVNYWIRESHADLIAFQHADDISAPNRIACMRDAFTRDPELLLLGSGTHYWLHHKSDPNIPGYTGSRIYPAGHSRIHAKLPFYWCFALPSVMFHRPQILARGLLLDEKFQYCADYDWYYRVCLAGKIDNLPDLLLSYRHHDESDGPRNRPEVNRESHEIRESIVKAEFENIATEDQLLLSNVNFEPECSPVDGTEFSRLEKLFNDKLATIRDRERHALFSLVYEECLQAVKPPSRPALPSSLSQITCMTTTKKLRFTLVMPNYTFSSNGVMVLYLLSDLLEQLGHHVTLVPLDREVFMNHRDHYPARYLEKFETRYGLVDPESIAIIPETASFEIVSGLNTRKRVWYLLNRPFILTREPIMYAPEDLVVAYSGLISKVYFNLFILREIPELTLPNGHTPAVPKENLILLYYGKSRTAVIPKHIKRLIKKNGAEVVVINRLFPKSRDLLFDLLKRARLLVSYDPLTNLNYEATLCGTPCYIIDNYMHLKFSDFNIPLYGIFDNKQEVSHYYDNGVNHELVIQTYKVAVANNRSLAEEFTHLCEDWFATTNLLNESTAGRRLLVQQNGLRILNDRLSHEQLGCIYISGRLQTYITPPIRVFDRIKNRFHRIKWKIIRGWYKHFRRIRGAELDKKLNEI